MTAIDSHPNALTAINNFLIFDAAAEDEAFREKLLAALQNTSPVMKYHDVAETVYANRDVASPAAKRLAGGLARFAGGEGFTGFDVDRRGSLIADILEAEAEGAQVPVAQADQPAAQERFAIEDAAAEEPEPEAPAA